MLLHTAGFLAAIFCSLLSFLRLESGNGVESLNGPEGFIVAGTGGSSCDDPADGAETLGFTDPVDISAAPDGFFYVLDRTCIRVSKHSSSGASGPGSVVVRASTGLFEGNLYLPQGIFFDAATGKLFIADTFNQRVMSWRPGDPTGVIVVEGGSRTGNGGLREPTGVYVRDGILFVVEQLNHRVQMFTLDSCCGDPSDAVGMTIFGCRELIPGSPPPICSKGFDVDQTRAPQNVFVTPSMDIFVTDTENHRVLLVSINSTSGNEDHDFSNYTTDSIVVAGTTGIPGCDAWQLRLPQAAVVDENGFLYVADSGNHRVQRFAPYAGAAGRVGITVAGECCCPRLSADGLAIGGSAPYQLNNPVALTLDPVTGSLLVLDRDNLRVLAFGGTAGGEQEVPRAFGASCAYGVECTVLIMGLVRAAPSGQLLIARRNVEIPADSNVTVTEANLTRPCGSFFCNIPTWPGLSHPQVVQGTYLDMFNFGVPRGPEDNTSTALGEYVLCYGPAPRTPCVHGECVKADNCSSSSGNSSSWLCANIEPFGMRRNVWKEVPGETVASLEDWHAYPDSPDLVELLPGTETRRNWGDNYGQQLEGLFAAPFTGSYTFHITSDHNSELRLSDTYNETGQVLAWISQDEVWWNNGFPQVGYTAGPDDWNRFQSQSGTVLLERGQLYRLEVLHKEGYGVDHLRVGVTLPDGEVLKPIPASYFTAKVCTRGMPTGLGVIHNCSGASTGQVCFAECRGGFVGPRQIFRCDGVGTFFGTTPVCTSVTCEDYDVEVGSFVMHGMLGDAAEIKCQTCDYDTGGSLPRGTTADEDDNIITTDTSHHMVVRFWGNRFNILAGGHGAGNESNQLHSPAGAYFVPGTPGGLPGALYVADTHNHRIVRWIEGELSGEVVFGTGSPGSNLTEMTYPVAIWVDMSQNGTMYIDDYGNNRILRVESGQSIGETLEERDSTNIPLLHGSHAEMFFNGNGKYYTADYGLHKLAVCFRSSYCSFSVCKDADHLAEYGPDCGCFYIVRCSQAYGGLAGGSEPPTSVRWK